LQKITVYTDKGEKLVLSNPLKKGGEGAIFKIPGDDDICAKIYYKNKLNTELYEKIMAMVGNSPGRELTSQGAGRPSASIAWPRSLLFSSSRGSSREFIGFTMPLVDTGLFREAHRYYDTDDRVRELGGAFSWRYLVTTAYNIAFVISAIHEKGHCVGDLSSTNVLVARTAAVTIIDCDSFQVRGAENDRVFYTKVGTGIYLPPELIGVDFRRKNIDRYYSDLFSLAIIIFNFLMGGVHPFQATGSAVRNLASTEEKIMAGYYPYSKKLPGVSPPRYAPPYAIIPPGLRVLFERCFVGGHRNPKIRPTAEEWMEELRVALDDLQVCNVNENHCYSSHLNECPWCALKKRGKHGKDIFPKPKITQSGHGKIVNTFIHNPVKTESSQGKIVNTFIRDPLKTESGHGKIVNAFIRDPLKTESGQGKIVNTFIRDPLKTESGQGKIVNAFIRDPLKTESGQGKIVNTFIHNPVKTESSQGKIVNTFIRDPLKTESGHGKIVNAFIRNSVKTESGHGKSGMDVSTPLKIAVPELDLPDKIFSFVISDENELIRQKFVLRNIGDGKMYGSISTGCDWISISPAVIDTYSVQMSEFTVDASKMDSVDNGVKYAGKIDISSNGGNSSVIVNILFKTEPVLEISDHVLSIKGVMRGAFESGSVKIINSGTGRLKGTVSADRDWIVVDKTLMDSRFFHSGRVTIDTNGGRKEILIVLTLMDL